MGNRAMIVFETRSAYGAHREVEGFGVYLHHNGGPESVYAFLDMLNVRMEGRGNDMGYAGARLCEIVGRFFGGNLSLGLMSVNGQMRALIKGRYQSIEALDHFDNGFYVIGYDHERHVYTITGRFNYIAGGNRWYTPEEIKREELDARQHVYWSPYTAAGTRKLTIFEDVELRALMGMGGSHERHDGSLVPAGAGEWADNPIYKAEEDRYLSTRPAAAPKKRSRKRVKA